MSEKWKLELKNEILEDVPIVIEEENNQNNVTINSE